MARSTKEEALETRNRILDAAENVFYAQGVAHTSLADVAEAANVTRGAIYWHFKNKTDLFDAMCERVRLPLVEMGKAHAEETVEDPLGKLRSGCIFVLTEAVNNPHSRKVFDILFHKCEFVDADDPISVRQREAFLHGTATLERVLTNAVAKGQLAKDLDTRLAAVMLHAAVNGLLKNWLFAPGSFNLLGNAEKCIDACFDTLRYAPSLRKQELKRESV